MTTFGLYGARLSLAVWRHFTCYIFFVFTYYFVLSLKNKYTILTTNLAAVVCVCATFDQFLALRSYFESIRPENFVRIAKFPYAAFGPLFAFHCPLFFTRNNDL